MPVPLAPYPTPPAPALAPSYNTPPANGKIFLKWTSYF
ncbi:LOL1 [Arabidopsis thaliana]|uniref:LOL1 n=1 Tax=Arabidopsis thaliana TaxID=3702 RepID=A0A178W493_ARATH|nr:LOL1 [Arabidopsis thaliana]